MCWAGKPSSFLVKHMNVPVEYLQEILGSQSEYKLLEENSAGSLFAPRN